MYEIFPYMTNDYSVGLYDSEVNDIYHSAFGALSEAFDKFINPAKEVIDFNLLPDNFNVLDICYGIGYNTKAFLQEAYNCSTKNINIDCVDTDINLIKLSPFISSKVSLIKRIFQKNKLLKNISDYDEVKKITSNYSEKISEYKIDDYVNLILLNSLIEDYGFEFLSEDLKNLLTDSQNFVFFDEGMLNSYQFLTKKLVQLPLKYKIMAFVHNIYYKYVTKRYKCLKSDRFNIHFYAKDIRKFVSDNLNKKYNLVLLDGFTPSKCPCIWSVDFFKALYNIMDTDGIIVTYNKSAPVRNAMIEAGFYVGTSLDTENKISGTVAALNINNIKHPLSKKDNGLLSTKAGIPYRDYNLSLDNDTIRKHRYIELEESALVSSSKYLKECKNEI